VHDLGPRGECRELAGDSVVEPGPERDDQVALLQRGDRRVRPVHARHAKRQRVGIGERSARHQRRGDGGLGCLGQRKQRLVRTGLDHATAGIEDWLARRAQQPGGGRDRRRVGRSRHLVAGQVHDRRPGPAERCLQDILRHVDEHRPRPPGRGDVKGLRDRGRDALRIGDQFVVLGDRPGNPGDVGLLERVGADHGGRHLAGDRDHGYRVHVRIGEGGDQVGRARAAGNHADPGAAGGPGVAFSRMPGALLVPDKHVPQPGIAQRIVGGQDRPARQAEDDLHPLVLQALDQGLGSGDVHE
jgi:hypothetical protein